MQECQKLCHKQENSKRENYFRATLIIDYHPTAATPSVTKKACSWVSQNMVAMQESVENVA